MTANIHTTSSATAEMIGCGHPDKACDQFGDAVLDAMIHHTAKAGLPVEQVRSAIEVLAKGAHVTFAGEIRVDQDVLKTISLQDIVAAKWVELGFAGADHLTVVDRLEPQSPEIASMIDSGGAGDQGIMVGAAFRETPDMMPLEYSLSRRLIKQLAAERKAGLAFLGSDAKSQISIDADGRIRSLIISTQHSSAITLDELREAVFRQVIGPVVGDIDPKIVKINHKGTFVSGGPEADAGVLGRKIVADAYGPRVPVGGGAYSGKDATKVDRSAAYQARQIARAILLDGFADGHSCVVTLAYGIGQHQPEAVTAIVDGKYDVADWVLGRFRDLSPKAIQDRLQLWKLDGWSYSQTAECGHYGHSEFPWEK